MRLEEIAIVVADLDELLVGELLQLRACEYFVDPLDLVSLVELNLRPDGVEEYRIKVLLKGRDIVPSLREVLLKVFFD